MSRRRTRVARGIYRDAYGYAIVWRDHGRAREKRFPSDTPLAVLKAWRTTRLQHAAPAPHEKAGSFTRDVVGFLRHRKGKPSFKSDRAHLRAWLPRFGRGSRWSLTREAIAALVGTWQAAGYSPGELRHRVKILKQLFRSLDPDAPTPADRIALPRASRPRPVSVADGLVREVALQLRKQEIAGRLFDAKTRARYLVLATTGQRPAQLRRAQPFDVDLDRGVWFVRPAKGDRGATVYLNDDMAAAWTLFIAARAWGAFNQRSFARTLQRNGWPVGVRPYNLRHTVGLSLAELGVDLGDIQAHMGHASSDTTRSFYVPGVPARLKDASARLDGRLGTAAFVPRATATLTRGQKATTRDITQGSARGDGRSNNTLRTAKSSESA